MTDLFATANAELASLDETLEALIALVSDQGKRIAAIEKLLEFPAPPPDPEPPPTPDPEPPPPVPTGKGIWIDADTIKQLPMTGPWWAQIAKTANGSWPTGIASQDSKLDTCILAGIYYAIRTGDKTIEQKTVNAFNGVIGTKFDRVLALGRQGQALVIVADLMDQAGLAYNRQGFSLWMTKLIEDKTLQGHNGDGVIATARSCANNWAMARALLVLAGLYMKRNDWVQVALKAHKEFIGLAVTNPELVYTDTTWHADPKHKAGINRKGAMKGDVYASGWIPEDWRRPPNTDGFTWLPGKTGYMWEAIQALVVTGVVLHRAGLLDFGAGDNAIVRSVQALYGLGEAAKNNPVFLYPAEGDDCWIIPVVNHYGGLSLPVNVGSPGKGNGFTGWLFP